MGPGEGGSPMWVRGRGKAASRSWWGAAAMTTSWHNHGARFTLQHIYPEPSCHECTGSNYRTDQTQPHAAAAGGGDEVLLKAAFRRGGGSGADGLFCAAPCAPLAAAQTDAAPR